MFKNIGYISGAVDPFKALRVDSIYFRTQNYVD